MKLRGCLLAVLAVLSGAVQGADRSNELKWETHPGYRVARLDVPEMGRSGLAEVEPLVSKVLFTNYLSESMMVSDSSLLGGSGVALGDIDGDGLCDLYFCSLAGRNALFRNLGNWRFEEIAEAAGVACPGQISRGAVFADVNGDGTLDLLVTARGAGVRCFLNDGKGHFREATTEMGLATKGGSTSIALADVDGNGTLDLFVANFGVGSVLRDGGSVSTKMVNGKLTVVGRMSKKVKVIDGQFVEFGEPSVLYLNDGKGHFTPLPWEGGAFLDEKGQPMETPWDFSLSVQMRDLNGDGWPDIYVCNDFFTPDRIWMNDGKGRFRAIPSFAIRKSSYAAMGVDFADIDRDGQMDGLIVEMRARDPVQRLRQMTPDVPSPAQIGGLEIRPQTGRNTFLWNRGDSTFSEIAEYSGLSASDWSWLPVFLDVDLDGFEDVLVPNGQTYDLQNLDVIQKGNLADPRASTHRVRDFPLIATPNCAFRNQGDRTFVECGKLWGFDALAACTGMAVADLDNDGGLDLVVNCLNTGALLYRNMSSAPRLGVRLKGTPPNTQGIGAMVKVLGGAVEFQSQEIIAGGRYLSGDDPMRVFAAGSTTNCMTIQVTWRNGKRSSVTDALPNCIYEIDESGAAEAPPTKAIKLASPLFEDATASLNHRHHEEPYEDFERQPLLPKRLSQLGPGVAWRDLAGDGKEELIIGSGRNGALAIYSWDGQSQFVRVPCVAGEQLAGDTAGMAAWSVSGRNALLVGQSCYEAVEGKLQGLLSVSYGDGGSVSLRPVLGTNDFSEVTIGPVAVGDIDGDGELEIFVGGRVIPGRYPEAAPSYILKNHSGVLEVDTNLSASLSHVGLVSGAVLSDLAGQGKSDLILACEWGPIRVFRHLGGHLVEITQELGLSAYTGWWQSVTTADLDGDGKMDIIAGNWGLNSHYRADGQHPLTAYCGSFNGHDGVQVLETVFDAEGRGLLPGRDWKTVSAGMPFILQRFANNMSFSQASPEQILGDRFQRALKVEAKTLASMVFLNRGTHFEAKPLPPEAQWAPVFGICAGDFDGDGDEDVFLGQNFFDLPAEGLRDDAGRGLLLKGDGKGGFAVMSGQVSGIKVYGEQRGCAMADYDGDGRLDLVISQNGEATRVFHNVGAKPGLRIRLRGPADNPSALGAVLRIRRGGKLGPAREIHAGSGYWSQDSLQQVMAADAGDELQVRWPGGKVSRFDLPASARDIEVNESNVRESSRFPKR